MIISKNMPVIQDSSYTPFENEKFNTQKKKFHSIISLVASSVVR